MISFIAVDQRTIPCKILALPVRHPDRTLASLASAFLLERMRPPWEGTRDWLTHFWHRRT